MKRAGATLLLSLLNLLATMAAANGSDRPLASSLNRNPFTRPLPSALAPAAPAKRVALSSDDLELRATLAAVNGPLANINGVTLQIGDKHRGWTLVAIGEGLAALESDGDRIELHIHEALGEDSDD